MPEARRHHFVSQCYLKGFTHDGSAESQLFVINVANGSTFSSTPVNVGVERDFNAVEGRPPGELEALLSKVESDIAPALDRIIAARSIENRDDWILVLNLIALFAVRNPRWRERVGEFISDLMNKIMSLALATPERWRSQIEQMKAAGVYQDRDREITYEEMKEFHERGEYDIKVAPGFQMGLEFKTFEPVLQSMVERSWTLIATDDKTGPFITTDHPVCLSHADFTPGGSATTRARNAWLKAFPSYQSAPARSRHARRQQRRSSRSHRVPSRSAKRHSCTGRPPAYFCAGSQVLGPSRRIYRTHDGHRVGRIHRGASAREQKHAGVAHTRR